MSGLRGNPASLRDLAKNLKTLPVTLAQDVAADVAPEITSRAAGAYDAGVTVYGDARPAGVHGNALSLVASGRTRSTVRFVAIGTVVRCVLGTRWSRYLIGKYGILPNGRLPTAWSEAIARRAKARIGQAFS